MTTRNFRVHNGISVGDIVIDAATNKITGGSTAAPSADGDYSNKKYVDDSIAAISTTSITTDSNATNAAVSGSGGSGILTITANSNTEVTVNDSGMQLGGSGARVNSILDQDDLSGNSDTALATQQSIKAYVDAQVTASDLDFQGDSGGALSIDLDSETLTFTGGTGIDTSGSSNTLTVAIDSTVATASSTHTLTNKTIDANGTGNNISNIEVDDFAAAAIINVSETLAGNDSDTALVTAGAIIDYVDAQDANIASDTLTFTNKTIDANGTGNSITNIDIGNMTAASIVLESEGIASNDNDTTLPTSAAVKDFVDTAVGAVSTTAITQLNTSATVSDSGSDGAFVVVADGNTELTINDTSATFNGNVVVSGNFTVNGTTTTVATTNTTNTDNIYELATGTTGTPANDAGLIIERGDSANAFIGFDESEDKFKVGTTSSTGSATGNLTITTGTLVANIEGNVTGDLTGTASAVADNSVALGTKTTGNYVATGAVSGSGLSGSASAEGATFTVTSNATSANTASTIVFRDGSGNFSAGTITANLTGTATAAQYSDVAERFASDSAYTPGTVVALGGAAEITQVNEEGSDEVFGVISSLSQAAFKMNGAAGNDETHPYIAMTGRVNVKVIGTVNKGDRLISASVPGYAKAAIKSECTAFNVIGRALTSKTEAGQGTVLAAVRVSH